MRLIACACLVLGEHVNAYAIEAPCQNKQKWKQAKKARPSWECGEKVASAGEAVCAGKGHPWAYGEGVQNRSPQNLPLWHIDYFKLKVLKQLLQEGHSDPPLP